VGAVEQGSRGAEEQKSRDARRHEIPAARLETKGVPEKLLQTPYGGSFYNVTPITRALLRLDPLWDPLRADPAFQKLCEEKQP